MWFAISRSLRPTLLPTFHRGDYNCGHGVCCVLPVQRPVSLQLVCFAETYRCQPLHAGLAAKAGKPSSAAPAQAKVEASTSTEPDSKPAVDYPDWLGRLTKPGRTLGELRRTPEDERTMTDVSHSMLMIRICYMNMCCIFAFLALQYCSIVQHCMRPCAQGSK